MRGNSMAIEQAAAGWLARRDGGRWNADDETALQRWLDADVGHRVAFLRLQAAWPIISVDQHRPFSRPPEFQKRKSLRRPRRVKVMGLALRLATTTRSQMSLSRIRW